MVNAAIKDPHVFERLEKLVAGGFFPDAWMIAVDEVGRGPLFGPVTVGGVLFKVSELFDPQLPDWGDLVNDSKKLKASLRKQLSEQIQKRYVCHVSHVSVRYIDRYNINRAIQYGVYRTVGGLLARARALNEDPAVSYVLLDGNYRFEYPQVRMTRQMPPICTIVKGDEHLFHISCASILAKEERDRLMNVSARRFSAYGLDKNAGYGTLHHRNAILEHGVTPFHRKLFVKKILGQE